MLPESNGSGGAITYPVGVHYYQVLYNHPGGGARVGIQFWHHVFDAGAPENSLYLLVYLNNEQQTGRRLFWAANAGPEAGHWWAVNFPMSTWINPGEQLAVVSVNNSGATRFGSLIVTLRECFP